MNRNAQTILAVIAVILAVIGLVRPEWRTTAVAVLLLAIAMLIGVK